MACRSIPVFDNVREELSPFNGRNVGLLPNNVVHLRLCSVLVGADFVDGKGSRVKCRITGTSSVELED